MATHGELFLCGHARWGAALVACVLGTHANPTAAAGELEAEYAVRWRASAGVPATPEAVLTALGLKKGKAGNYKVQYFDVDPSAAPMAGFSVVVRERIGTKTDTAWKYRGAQAPSPVDRNTWRCPLSNEDKRKDELDVSIFGDTSTKRTYSRSCTSKQVVGKALPPEIKLKPRGCIGEVSLLEAKGSDVSVERWQLKSGAVFLEVSWKGEATPAALESAYASVVRKLVARGVQPLDRSMTDIASDC